MRSVTGMNHEQYLRAESLPAAQRGQALVLGLFLVVLIALALIYQFGVGQIASRKARLVHATDAAAYSGALVQARALNMQAYINLTQTAHQVAMAHLVTLGSWSLFAATQGRQFLQFNPPAHVIAMMFGPRPFTAYTAATHAITLDGMARKGGELARLFAEHDRIVRHVLFSASRAVHNTMRSARDHAMEQVLQQNYQANPVTQVNVSSFRRSEQPDSDVPVRTPSDNHAPLVWYVQDHTEGSFTSLQATDANYRSFITDVVSVYDFLGRRGGVIRNNWEVHYQCPELRHELRRRGQTLLDENGNWQSIDTQSYHALRSNQYIGCYYREYPMGWGWVPGKASELAADLPYDRRAPENFGEIDFWRWVTTSTNWNILSGDANPLANSRAVVGKEKWSGGGLVPYFDLRDSDGQRSLGFTLHVSQHFHDQPALAVQSSAETFFEKPGKSVRNEKEKPGTWRPFWQAHLIGSPSVSPSVSSSPEPLHNPSPKPRFSPAGTTQ